jgi:hypothetical protein
VIPAALAALAAATSVCLSPERLVTWPTPRDPTWSLCVLTPRDSTGASGSGLEIRDVRYNGRRVLRRAHAPVVNAFYQGGCGCSRGWLHEESPFEVVTAEGPASGGPGSWAEAVVPPRTTCDLGSTDAGAFRGVAAERLSDRLVLTSQMSAGWHRYTMSWILRRDGTIEPRFAFAAAPSSCSSHAHVQHVYWRFDFHLDGGSGTSAREELRRVWDRRMPPVIVMGDLGRGYFVIPGPEALAEPAHDSAVGDIWLLRPKPAELTDASQGCAIDLGGMLDDEPLPGGRAVVWYRGSVAHHGGRFDECQRVGPTLQPVGDWSRPVRP